MATRGKIQVVRQAGHGEFIVQGADAGSVQLLAEALGKLAGLKIEAGWPRRRGGATYPKLRLTKEKP